MKTYKQLQESIVKALAMFGNVGLRVASQASKSKGARRILDATARRAKLDQLIIKNQKRLKIISF